MATLNLLPPSARTHTFRVLMAGFRGATKASGVLSSGPGAYQSPRPAPGALSIPAAGDSGLTHTPPTAPGAFNSDATPLLSPGKGGRTGSTTSGPLGSTPAGGAVGAVTASAAVARSSGSEGEGARGGSFYGTMEAGRSGDGTPPASVAALPPAGVATGLHIHTPSAPHSHPHLHVHATAHYAHTHPPSDTVVLREAEDELRAVGDDAAVADTTPGKPSFMQELRTAFTNPIYLAVVLGYAGFTGVVAGESDGKEGGRLSAASWGERLSCTLHGAPIPPHHPTTVPPRRHLHLRSHLHHRSQPRQRPVHGVHLCGRCRSRRRHHWRAAGRVVD